MAISKPQNGQLGIVRRRICRPSGARATEQAAKGPGEIERVHSRVRVGSNGGKPWAGEVVTNIVVAVNERQRDVERKQRIAVGCGMLAEQNQGKAKIVKQLQEKIIIPAMEIVLIKIPAPGSAENRGESVSAHVVHDGARVKDDFVAGLQDASAGVHVLVVGAEAQVVAADLAENAGAKNGAEAADALGHG